MSSAQPGRNGSNTNSRKRERDPELTLPKASIPNNQYDDVSTADETNPGQNPSPPAPAGFSTTNFRNVSACDRCRNRKNRCDQKLPRCSNCEKARVKCVGFDPVSKRKIPRSYVYYLETRVKNLEALLTEHGVDFPPPEEDFAIDDAIKPGINVPFPILEDGDAGEASADTKPVIATSSATNARQQQRPLPARGNAHHNSTLDPALQSRRQDEGANLNKLVNHDNLSSARGAPDPRYQPSANGISFARIVMEAVKTSAGQSPANPSARSGARGSRRASSNDAAAASAAGSSTTIKDSFFGLHTRPSVKSAPFPEKELAIELVDLYFGHANPQIPVLHREEFHALFERVYAKEPKKRTPRELYMLNIVFAIGSGIIMDAADVEQPMSAPEPPSPSETGEAPSKKRLRIATHKHQPEEYHASAIVHLEHFLGSPPATEGVSGGLEELQAVVLLAGLALLRPVAPGLWYIIGVAVRLSIDLGLHFEDIDHDLDSRAAEEVQAGEKQRVEFGRKQWTRDLRRRLWWCVFNLDRLVSSCVGRPVSINEAVVTTEFPSMLDDRLITPTGFLRPPDSEAVPSYKVVSRHYLRLRLLQSEIMQVLQHKQADHARSLGAHQNNPYLPSDLMPAYLQPFGGSFREWRRDVNRRLDVWRVSAPSQEASGVVFNPLFYELNYWQAIIMLYRQSLSVPEPLASELSVETGEEVQSPGALQHLEFEEDKQMVFSKVAHAGHMVLRTYRTLHRDKLVNYTFLSTHHLFISGISFLYALWHSPFARSQFTVEEVDFTVLAATSVLSDLSVKCPPAEACREAFERMSRETISHIMKTTKFGAAAQNHLMASTRHGSSAMGGAGAGMGGGYFGQQNNTSSMGRNVPPAYQLHQQQQQQRAQRKMRVPKFDYNLKGLFSEEEIATHHFLDGVSVSSGRMAPPSVHPFSSDRSPPQTQAAISELSPLQRTTSAGSTYQHQQQHSPMSTQTTTGYQPPSALSASDETIVGRQRQQGSPQQSRFGADPGRADLDFRYMLAPASGSAEAGPRTDAGKFDSGSPSEPWTTGEDDNGNAASGDPGMEISMGLMMDFGFDGTGGGFDGSAAWDTALEPLDPFFFGESMMNGF